MATTLDNVEHGLVYEALGSIEAMLRGMLDRAEITYAAYGEASVLFSTIMSIVGPPPREEGT